MTQSNGGTEKKQHVFFDNTVSLKYYFSIVDTFDNRDKKNFNIINRPIYSAGEICERTKKEIDVITSSAYTPHSRLDSPGNESRWGRRFRTRPDLPTQPPIQRARGPSRELNGRDVALTTHPI